MRIRTLAQVAAACAALLAAAPSGAQGNYTADFSTARRLFLEKDVGHAAYAVSVASAYVRQEVGRCQDAGVGERLMGAEDRLDKLVARLRANQVESVATLDSTFAQTDRLLAEHHWRLASWEFANQRNATRAAVGEDLDAAARFYVRSLKFAGRELDAAAAQAVTDARRVASVITTTDVRPNDAQQAIEALGKFVVPTAAVAAQ